MSRLIYVKTFESYELLIIKKMIYDSMKKNNDDKKLSVYKDFIKLIIEMSYDYCNIYDIYFDFIVE